MCALNSVHFCRMTLAHTRNCKCAHADVHEDTRPHHHFLTLAGRRMHVRTHIHTRACSHTCAHMQTQTRNTNSKQLMDELGAAATSMEEQVRSLYAQMQDLKAQNEGTEATLMDEVEKSITHRAQVLVIEFTFCVCIHLLLSLSCPPAPF